MKFLLKGEEMNEQQQNASVKRSCKVHSELEINFNSNYKMWCDKLKEEEDEEREERRRLALASSQ
jgi:hypothetical protein